MITVPFPRFKLGIFIEWKPEKLLSRNVNVIKGGLKSESAG